MYAWKQIPDFKLAIAYHHTLQSSIIYTIYYLKGNINQWVN